MFMSLLSVVLDQCNLDCRLGAFRNEAEEKTPPEKTAFKLGC